MAMVIWGQNSPTIFYREATTTKMHEDVINSTLKKKTAGHVAMGILHKNSAFGRYSRIYDILCFRSEAT